MPAIFESNCLSAFFVRLSNSDDIASEARGIDGGRRGRVECREETGDVRAVSACAMQGTRGRGADCARTTRIECRRWDNAAHVELESKSFVSYYSSHSHCATAAFVPVVREIDATRAFDLKI
jgi:hypothetical protein